MTDATSAAPGPLRGHRDRAALIAGLAASPGRLAAAVRGATDADLDREPAPGEWPARTVLAHLRDDEFMAMRLRIERMLVEDEPALAPFDEQQWAASRWHGGDSTRDLLEGFRIQRAATCAILRRLSDEDWRRLGSQPEIGTFDVHWWVGHTLEHDEVHLAQLARALGR
ncbi:MAG: DinB family protein [Dehalococcoidia bacterium]|nr:DinB family protein [Dehalococcoidia bacterium]